MEKYGSLQLFPVKVQVPLIMSLRATLHVKNILLWDGKASGSVAAKGIDQPKAPPDIEFWDPPAHYKHVSIDELDAEHMAKRAAAKRAAREKRETARRQKQGHSSSRSGSAVHGSRDVAESAPI